MSRALRAPRVLAAAVVTASLLAGATSFAVPRPAPGLELGVMGCRPVDAEWLAGVEARNAFGYGVAGILGWKLSGPLSFRPGLRLSHDVMAREYGLTVTTAFSPSGAITGTSRVHFLRLGAPVRFGVVLPAGRGWSLEAGAEPQYLLHAWLDDDVTVTPAAANRPAAPVRDPAAPAASIFEQVGRNGDVTDLQPRWNLLLAAGVRWEFPLRAATGALHLRYHHGALDQAKAPEWRDYTRMLELGMGVSW